MVEHWESPRTSGSYQFSDEDTSFLDPDKPSVTRKQQRKKSEILFIVLTHCGISLLYGTIIYFFLVPPHSEYPHRWGLKPGPYPNWLRRQRNQTKIYVTALPDLRVVFKSQQYDFMRNSPYIGHPSNGTDESWNSLFSNMSIRVTDKEFAITRQSSVPLPNGGRLAWLGVYHELHCVKVLRKMVYREHYHPNMTDADLRDRQVHADHCVDMLRQALMCHGDVESLTTFIWDERYKKPLLSPQRPSHTCYDWGVVTDSLKDRVVSLEELDLLQQT